MDLQKECERHEMPPLRFQTGIETQPGDPESDTVFFYIDAEKTSGVAINYDESKAGAYPLEDPLVFADGRPVADAADWGKRRKEILKLFEDEMYGRLPPRPAALRFELLSEEPAPDFDCVKRVYRMHFTDDGRVKPVDWLLMLPAKRPAKPGVILQLTFEPIEVTATGKTRRYEIPHRYFAERGYAFLSANYADITSDPGNECEFRNGAFDKAYRAFGEYDYRDDRATGALMTWAWGLMRGLDLAETIPEIDPRKSVVTGCSRLGKAALLAGAYDERFAVVVPNQSGGGGVQLLKRDFGESPAAMMLMFPHWFSPKYMKTWADDPRRQPFDQHLLVSAVAPRNLLLACYHKKWFDPTGEFLSAQAAAPVWKFLTGKTLEAEKLPRAYDTSFLMPPFGYETRRGSHGIDPFDWCCLLDFADRCFCKTV